MKKLCMVLTVLIVMGVVTGCGCRYDPEVVNDIQVTANGVYADVTDMSEQVTDISTEVSEIKEAVNKMKSSNNKASKSEIEEYKKKAESLQEQLDKVTEEKEALETSKTPKYQEYIDSVFPKNGTWVLREGTEVQFYSDVTCTKEIETPKFASNTVNDSATDKNNRRPHSLRTTDDQIVYCVSWPDLVNENH